MQSEYDRLKNEGYTEEEIKVQLDNLNKIKISSDPMGNNRDDRAVHITDSQGNERRTSSIMMGYNKDNIKLDNGEFVSLEELEDAIRKAAFISGENKTIMYKPTSKTISVNEFVSGITSILKSKEEIILRGSSPNITNQQTAKVFIKGEDENKEYSKGVFMLGNNNIALLDGEYVSVDELQKALNDYAFVEEKKIEEEQLKEIKKIKNITILEKTKIKIWPLIVAAGVALGGSSLDINMDKITEKPKTLDTTIEKVIENEEAQDYTTGEKINVPEGLEYYSNSSRENNYRTGQFGGEERSSGEYTLEYFSILDKEGKHKIKVVYEEGQNLNSVIEEVCKDNNISPDDVNVMFHIGGPVSGWISLDDLQNMQELSDKEIGQNLIVENEYHSKTENFEGFVTIETETGPVTLNFMDNNNELIKDGTIVRGSDGKEYRVSNVNLNYEALKLGDIVRNVKKSIDFDFHGIDKEMALLGAATALGLTALTVKKTKEEKEMETEKEYEKAREEFIKDSEHKKIIEKLNGDIAKVGLENGSITIDEMSEMHSRGI